MVAQPNFKQEKKAGELLQSKRFHAKALAKKGYSIAVIASLLKLSRNTVTKYLLE